MNVRPFQGKTPRLGRDAWVADNAIVVGDVTLGVRASIWFGCVLRCEGQPIVLGDETNIQDNSVIHVTNARIGTKVGARVTVGHRVMLHGCTIGDDCLIGIGSIVLDGAQIGSESIVAAGSMVSPGTQIPPRVLALGSPARVKRPLTDAELAAVRENAADYVRLASLYRAGG
jgi:carbonic anhydrase/acetyltransferase-like protein (isoleucine patch superfamily)